MFRRALRCGNKPISQRQFLVEPLESRAMMSVLPIAGELTEGNASAWEAFAAGSTATASVSNDTSLVKVGSQSLKFTTTGGADAGVRLLAPPEHWNLTGSNLLDIWAYGDNNHPQGKQWQGNQPVVKLLSPNGSLELKPNKLLMPNHEWSLITVPFAGDAVWTATKQGTFDFYDVTAVEIHQDTWDFGFTSYYDGVQFAQRGVLESNFLAGPRGVAVDSNNRTLVVEGDANRVRIMTADGDGVALIGLRRDGG